MWHRASTCLTWKTTSAEMLRVYDTEHTQPILLWLSRHYRMTAYTPKTSRFACGCSSMSFASIPVFENGPVSNTCLKWISACNDNSVDLSHWQFPCDDWASADGVFLCEVTVDQGNVKWRSACGRSACRQPSTHFYLKYGYSVCALRLHTCLIPLMLAVIDLHEKRPALPEKLNRASQEGKD